MPEPGAAQLEVTIIANDVGGVGGMERQLTELILGLLRAGHAVTVISWTCALDHPQLRWVRVPGPSRPFAIAYPLFLLIASLLVWRHSRGIVHSTGAIVLNRTAVCTVHFCHQAIAELPAIARASRSGPAYRLNARVARTMSRAAERWCYRRGRAAQLIGVSEGVARELRRHFPRMDDRIAVIPNGVDTEEFRPAATGEAGRSSADGLRALFVGSEWERKGLRAAVEALADCPGATLTVVGEGDTAAYRGLARSLGVEDRVEFAGRSEDVAAWYRRADVFVLPTAYETFSLVTYEAAASGLPLLVSRVNGVEDLLREGENGWFVERDPGEIAARLRQLLADPELRAALGRRAREDSLGFSWGSVVERYEALYRA